MNERIPQADWSNALANFTERNAGRFTSLEIDDPMIGAQEQEREFRLRGVVYEPRANRIEIMLGDFEGVGPHLTHSVDSVAEVDLIQDDAGRDTVLRLGHDGSQTLLRIEYH